MRLLSCLVVALGLMGASLASAGAVDTKNGLPIVPVGPVHTTYVLHFAPEPAVFITLLDLDPAKCLTPPSMEQIKYSGHGVSREPGEAMQKSRVAGVATFTYAAVDALAEARPS